MSFQDTTTPPTARVFAWDWREQPPMQSIAGAVMDLSAGGRVFMREVDTQSDEYAWVISSDEMSDEQAERLYFDEDQ